MFELASAIFSIADANEFRFARFYIVCEAVPLGTLGNPLIVCGLSDTFRGLSKRGRDTESDANIQQEEMHTFFSNEFPFVFPSEIPRCGLLIILLIKAKHDMLIATILSYICLVLKRDNGSVIGVVDILLDLVRL